MTRAVAHWRLAPVSLVGAAFLSIACDGIAQARISETAFFSAIASVFQQPAANIGGIALLLLPVLGAHLLAVELARVTTIGKAAIFLAVVLALLTPVYVLGFSEYHTAMESHKWTSASISLGLIPIKGAAVLVLPLIAVIVMTRKARSSTTRLE